MVTLKGDVNIVEGYLNETKTLAKLQGDDSVIRLFELYALCLFHIVFYQLNRSLLSTTQ